MCLIPSHPRYYLVLPLPSIQGGPLEVKRVHVITAVRSLVVGVHIWFRGTCFSVHRNKRCLYYSFIPFSSLLPLPLP